LQRLFGVHAGLSEILWLDIADVKEPIPADAKINKRGLDTGFQIHDLPFEDVPDVIFSTRSFDEQFFEHPIFDERDAALFRLSDVDQQLFFVRFLGLGPVSLVTIWPLTTRTIGAWSPLATFTTLTARAVSSGTAPRASPAGSTRPFTFGPLAIGTVITFAGSRILVLFRAIFDIERCGRSFAHVSILG
jgi:hypothetical protein